MHIMECEVCGKRIYGGGRNIIIDGAKLIVCNECARSSTPAPQTYEVQETVSARALAPKAIKGRQSPAPSRDITPIISEDTEVVKNYGSLVRNAREKIGLTHDELSKKIGVKVSVLQKVETSKMVPDQDTARKLEHALKIKLLQPISKVPIEDEFKKPPTELTLGDMVFVQDDKKIIEIVKGSRHRR
jgi:putative transcription factor